MSAKEMFEKLGYKCLGGSDYIAIKYYKQEKQRENYSKRNYKAKEYIKMYCPMLDNETKPIWNKILNILEDGENK